MEPDLECAVCVIDLYCLLAQYTMAVFLVVYLATYLPAPHAPVRSVRSY